MPSIQDKALQVNYLQDFFIQFKVAPIKEIVNISLYKIKDSFKDCQVLKVTTLEFYYPYVFIL